jgi:hypothetical protein
MDAEIPQSPLDWDFWSQGLDRKFFGRVHKHAAIIGIMAALALLLSEQRAVALGGVCGLGAGLFSLWSVEVTVRLLFKGGSYAGLKLAIAAAVKLPFLLVGLLGIAWAADQRIMNIFAVICGVLLVHGTMLVMVIGTALANQDRIRERY